MLLESLESQSFGSTGDRALGESVLIAHQVWFRGAPSRKYNLQQKLFFFIIGKIVIWQKNDKPDFIFYHPKLLLKEEVKS